MKVDDLTINELIYLHQQGVSVYGIIPRGMELPAELDFIHIQRFDREQESGFYEAIRKFVDQIHNEKNSSNRDKELLVLIGGLLLLLILIGSLND